MNASPALRALDREDNHRLAEQFADALLARDPTIDYEDAVLTLLTAIEAALAVVDLTYDLPNAVAERHLELCIEMQNGFLAQRLPLLAGEQRS